MYVLEIPPYGVIAFAISGTSSVLTRSPIHDRTRKKSEFAKRARHEQWAIDAGLSGEPGVRPTEQSNHQCDLHRITRRAGNGQPHQVAPHRGRKKYIYTQHVECDRKRQRSTNDGVTYHGGDAGSESPQCVPTRSRPIA